MVFEMWFVVMYHLPSSKFDDVEKNMIKSPSDWVLDVAVNVFPAGLVSVAETGEFGFPVPLTSIISPDWYSDLLVFTVNT
jgi:hypothetical protein